MKGLFYCISELFLDFYGTDYYFFSQVINFSKAERHTADSDHAENRWWNTPAILTYKYEAFSRQ